MLQPQQGGNMKLLVEVGLLAIVLSIGIMSIRDKVSKKKNHKEREDFSPTKKSLQNQTISPRKR